MRVLCKFLKTDSSVFFWFPMESNGIVLRGVAAHMRSRNQNNNQSKHPILSNHPPIVCTPNFTRLCSFSNKDKCCRGPRRMKFNDDPQKVASVYHSLIQPQKLRPLNLNCYQCTCTLSTATWFLSLQFVPCACLEQSAIENKRLTFSFSSYDTGILM